MHCSLSFYSFQKLIFIRSERFSRRGKTVEPWSFALLLARAMVISYELTTFLTRFLVKVSEQEMDVIMTDPFKYVSDHVKRKIRNLEKRKEKLDGYKAKLAKGDKLNADQLDASNTIAHFLAFSNVFSRKIRRSNWHDHICE